MIVFWELYINISLSFFLPFQLQVHVSNIAYLCIIALVIFAQSNLVQVLHCSSPQVWKIISFDVSNCYFGKKFLGCIIFSLNKTNRFYVYFEY